MGMRYSRLSSIDSTAATQTFAGVFAAQYGHLFEPVGQVINDSRAAVVFRNATTLFYALMDGDFQLHTVYEIYTGDPRNPSIAVTAGLPAITVYDAGSETLKYFRSINALGDSTWVEIPTTPGAATTTSPLTSTSTPLSPTTTSTGSASSTSGSTVSNAVIVQSGQTETRDSFPGDLELKSGSTLQVSSSGTTVVDGEMVVDANVTLIVAGVLFSGTVQAVLARSIQGTQFSTVEALAACETQTAQATSTTYSTTTVSVAVALEGDSCSSGGGLSTGVIVGIAVGAAVGGVLLAILIVLLIRWSRNRRTDKMSSQLKATALNKMN